MPATAPRSTRSHCGSTPSLLAQRVDALPSTALPAGNDELSSDEAVAGRPWESSAGPPVPPTVRVNLAAWVAAAAAPVTVMVAVPAAAAPAVATVIVEVPPAVTDDGLKLTVTPAGAPLADSFTDCAVPDTTDVDTFAVVDAPAVTEPDPGLTESAKSLPPVPAGVKVRWLAAPEQLPATTLAPDARTHLCPVWISEIVPFGLTDHCCAGPPVQVCSATFPPEIPAHLLLMIRKAPWKVNCWLAALLHAAVTRAVPDDGALRHCPVDLFRYWPTVLCACAPP